MALGSVPAYISAGRPASPLSAVASAMTFWFGRPLHGRQLAPALSLRWDTHTLAAHRSAPGRLYSAAGDGYFESLDNGDTWRRVMEGLEHGYCWSIAVSLSDPDTVLLSASKSPRAAHSKEFANSGVYRRSAHEPWRKALDGLPDPEGRRVPVLAQSDLEPGVFYVASEGELYCSANSGAEWQKLTVDWAERCSPQHASDIAVVES